MIPSETPSSAEQASRPRREGGHRQDRRLRTGSRLCGWPAAAKKVVVVPLTFDAGRRRNEASVEEIAQQQEIHDVFVFRTSRLTP